MKFYGIQFGCNSVLNADNSSEIITVCTFGERSTCTSLHALSRIAKAFKHECEYDDIRELEPNVRRVSDLNNECSFRLYHKYHYRVANDKITEFNKALEQIFPSSQFVALK